MDLDSPMLNNSLEFSSIANGSLHGTMSTGDFTAIYVGRGTGGRPSEPAQDISLGSAVQGTADRSEPGPDHQPGVDRIRGATYAARAGVHVIAEGRPRWSSAEFAGVSGSVSERILNLYEKHGESLLDITAGEFAIAVVDTSRRQTLLGLDRMGIRSMYFAVAEKTFQELKPINIFRKSFLPKKSIWWLKPLAEKAILCTSFAWTYLIQENTWLPLIKRFWPNVEKQFLKPLKPGM